MLGRPVARRARRHSRARWRGARASGVCLALLAAASSVRAETVDVFLCAGAFDKAMPDGTVVRMWGFAERAGAQDLQPGCASGASSPGPRLSIPPPESDTPTRLDVHLFNDGLSEPVSFVVPGQHMALEPVRNPDGRVRSFAAETAAGETHTYTIPALTSGTYAYSSGSHPAIQVQMGLYGALTHDVATGEAYRGVSYDHDLILLYAAIDPELHAQVASGTYGRPPFTSAIDYAPQYFLVNGEVWSEGAPEPYAGEAGRRTLLRLLNLGLESRAPLLLGAHVDLVAEDGHPYPHPRQQYSLLLAASKATDALWVPDRSASYPLLDRRLPSHQPESGQYTRLRVTSPDSAPSAAGTPEELGAAASGTP